MSDDIALLAQRKQLLLARSRLHRLEIVHEAQLLRGNLTRPRTLLSIVTSAPVASLLVGGLLLAFGGSRLSKLVQGAMAALAIVKGFRSRGGA